MVVSAVRDVAPTQQRRFSDDTSGLPCIAEARNMRPEELHYELPPGHIATRPAEPRDSARLMVVHRRENRIEHRLVRDLPAVLCCLARPPLMLLNETRVVPARFEGTRAATNGKVRGLYLASPAADRWLVMLESRGTLTPGERITLTNDSHIELTARVDNGTGGEWEAKLRSPCDTLTLLDRIGGPPLPPYILKARKHRQEPQDTPTDRDRYNTIYARQAGSVAAPTAGLHFTPQLFQDLDGMGVARAYVTLHVGLGTFAPLRTQRVEDHPIHAEQMQIPPGTIRQIADARETQRPLLVVGTTTVRALESLPENWREQAATGYATDTRLFITPDKGYQFRFTDVLMTNFHLPSSTLLALVAALPGVGVSRLLDWYRTAVAENYRFYSYGDAMLLLP